ncbi:MAG: hypothetical protein ACFFC7_17810 [Candidatus Hermodarchaeota archaeon]
MIQAIFLVDKKSGLPLLSRPFGEFAFKKDDSIVTGLFSILESYIRELVKGETATEPEMIALSGFKIIYASKNDLPILFVALVDEQTDAALTRDKLTALLELFCSKYEDLLEKFPFVQLSEFASFLEIITDELQNGTFAHIEKVYPTLKDKSKEKINFLKKFGMLKPTHYKVASLCNAKQSVLDIAKKLELEVAEVQTIIKYLAAQGLIELEEKAD